MTSQETPFSPETIDQQLENLEAALQSTAADQPEMPNRQLFAALQQVYTAEQHTYQASLQQVRQRLLRERQAVPAVPLPRQQPPAALAGRGILQNLSRHGGLPARLGALVAAILITLLVGGLVAGLILVRPGGNHTGSISGDVEVRLQPACAITTQHCSPNELALLSQDRAVLEHRLQDALGNSAWSIRQEGSDLIVVDLPPRQQQQETIDLLTQTGLLQILDTGQVALQVNEPVPPGSTYPVPFTGGQLNPTSIKAVTDPMSNQPEILFQFKGSAQRAFADYTGTHIGYYLTITLDNSVIESAIIQSQITGQGVISGGRLTMERAQYIATLLRSGPLPLPLSVMS